MTRTHHRTFSLLAIFVLVAAAQFDSIRAAHAGTEPSEPDITVEFIPDEPGTVGTMSASGCNIDVCIYLYGSGLTVDKWETTGTVTSSTCSYARFYADDTLIATSSTICSSGSGTLKATWNNPGWFADGTQLCNSWSGISGYPCKTVHD